MIFADSSMNKRKSRDGDAMIFADSSMNKRKSREDSSMNLNVNVRKNQRRVCFIRGEEFHRVGRTIFIKLKCFFLPIY